MSIQINRRLRDGMITETVHAWHYREQGPGEPGGRTYDVIYGRSGRVRIDVIECWGSSLHTIFLDANEIRPQQEWRDHLLATGQHPVEPRWCEVDGVEIPADRIAREVPEDPERHCSAECWIEAQPTW